MRPKLLEHLSDYPKCEPQRRLQLDTQFDRDGPTQVHHETFHGFRLTSADGHQIAQFNRDGLVFSRLEPYDDWQEFSNEGLRLWRVFLELAAPFEIQRLGVRFINRIALKRVADASRFLAKPPKCLESLGLPVSGFLYQSIHSVPGHPFQINVTQTIQRPDPPQSEQFGLILDIDVSMTKALDCDNSILEQHLARMRCLKDKAFFSLLKPKIIATFQKDRK